MHNSVIFWSTITHCCLQFSLVTHLLSRRIKIMLTATMEFKNIFHREGVIGPIIIEPSKLYF